MITHDPDPAGTHQDFMNELNGARRPARLVLPGTAGEAEWLEARRKGITASEIAVLMGLSSWSSPFKLYHQKTGELPADEQGDRLRLGHVLEPYIAGRFGERHHDDGFLALGDGRSLYAHPGRPWQMATPDRILVAYDDYAEEPLAVLECKSWGTFDGWGDEGSDEIPVFIRCQVLWQMDVMGVGTGFVACLFLPGAQLRVYELSMDYQAQSDLQIMRSEAMLFLGRIKAAVPPDVDWRPSTTDALKRLHPLLDDTTMTIPARLAAWYRAACRDVKAAGKRKALYENQIRDVIGTSRYAGDPDGYRVARRDVYDLPAKTIHRRASTVDRLIAVAQREDKQS